MKILYVLALMQFVAGVTMAQLGTSNFFGNNYGWSQNTNGVMFNNSVNQSPGFEIPFMSGNYGVYTHSMLFAGIDETGQVRSHFQLFCSDPAAEACQEVHGPLKIGAAANEGDEVAMYNRIWYILRAEVDLHIAYFDCVQDPNCDIAVEYPNYAIPENLSTWPAHGDTSLGYAYYLAPFVDVNADGVYNAQEGDYPNFCGDFMTYMIHNDVGEEESSYTQLPAGIEIHTQMYGYYQAENNALYNTIFVRHKVINRSEHTYSDAYLGTFTDFDLGNPSDDYIGTDVARSMYYVYNGDANDEVSFSGPGYGDDLPAIGVKYLAGPLMDSDGQDNEFNNGVPYGEVGPGWGDGITDNERMGLSSVLYNMSSSTGVMALPSLPTHHYHMLSGVWPGGTPAVYGGIGYNPDCTDCLDTKYVFPGDSDPLFMATDGEDPEYVFEEGWTEETEGNLPDDRRIIAGSGPFAFEPGSIQNFDYAMIFARESHDENQTVIETLQQYADEIVGMQCGEIPDVTTGIFETPKQLKFKVYPNPATDRVNIQLPRTFHHVRVEVLDMQSRIIYSRDLSQTDKGQIELDVARGQYILRVVADGEIGVSKMTKM